MTLYTLKEIPNKFNVAVAEIKELRTIQQWLNTGKIISEYPKLPEDSELHMLTLEEILKKANDFKTVINIEEDTLSQLRFLATSKRGLLDTVSQQYIEDNQV